MGIAVWHRDATMTRRARSSFQERFNIIKVGVESRSYHNSARPSIDELKPAVDLLSIVQIGSLMQNVATILRKPLSGNRSDP